MCLMLKPDKCIYLTLSVSGSDCCTAPFSFRAEGGGAYSLDSLIHPEVQTCRSRRNLVASDFFFVLLHEPDNRLLEWNLLRLVFS